MLQNGCSWRSSAATPAMCGHAIDVPLITAVPPPGASERMFTPGATTSGLIASGIEGPPELKFATPSFRSDAPTVIADGADAGAPIWENPPPLPDATATIAPASTAFSPADDTGDSASPGPPRL